MKRTTALILLFCILSLLIAVPTSAQGEVFVAAGNTVLPLTDAMPIKSNGAWYIDYKCFTEGTIALNASYNASAQKLVLYDWDTTLIFDLATTTAYTVKDNIEYKTAIVAAAGTVYIPAQFTAQIFGLTVTYHQPLSLIRITRPNDIPYSMFQYIAKNTMPKLLETYHAQKNPVQETPQSQPQTQPQPQTPPSPPKNDSTKNDTPKNDSTKNDTPKNEEIKKGTLRLTFNIENGENFAKILNQLSQYGRRATFFINKNAIPKCENEIRRAIVQGHSIGILATSHDELSLTNSILFDIAKTKTRLVRFKSGSSSLSADVVDKVIAAGYRLWDYDIAPAETSASKMYSNVIAKLDTSSRSTVLALSDSDVSISALGRILNYLSTQNYSAYIINILDTPINQISERR